MSALFPLTLTVNLQPGRVNENMAAPFGWLIARAKVNPKRLLAPREGRVIWNRQVHVHPRKQRLDKTLRLPQGQPEHEPQRQASFNGQIRIDGLASAPGGAIIFPLVDRLLADPDRQRPSLSKALIIDAPVSNFVS